MKRLLFLLCFLLIRSAQKPREFKVDMVSWIKRLTRFTILKLVRWFSNCVWSEQGLNKQAMCSVFKIERMTKGILFPRYRRSAGCGKWRRFRKPTVAWVIVTKMYFIECKHGKKIPLLRLRFRKVPSRLCHI